MTPEQTAIIAAVVGAIVSGAVALLVSRATVAQEAQVRREEARRERLLRELGDTEAAMMIELARAAAFGTRDHDKLDRLALFLERLPFPNNYMPLLGPDAERLLAGMMELAGVEDPVASRKRKRQLQEMVNQRIRRQRTRVEAGLEPEMGAEPSLDALYASEDRPE